METPSIQPDPGALRTRFARLVPCMMLLFALMGSFATHAQFQTTNDFSTRDAVNQRLQTLHTEMAEADNISDPAHQEALQLLEAALYQHLEAIENLEQMSREKQQIEQQLQQWKGLEQDPPYSILLSNEIRSKVTSLNRQLQAAKTRLEIIEDVIDDESNALTAAAANERRFNEQADLTPDGSERRQLRQSAQANADSARILAENVARLKLRLASHELQIKAIDSALELNTKILDAINGQVQFTDEELAAVTSGLVTERNNLLAQVRASADKNGNKDQVTWKIELLELATNFWSQLHQAFSADQEAERFKAVDQIHALKPQVDAWVEVITLQTARVTEESVGARATQNDLQRVVRLQDQVDFSLQELEQKGIQGESLFNNLFDISKAFWNFELYLAEDTVLVGGNKITVNRQVTVGKLARLVAIIIFGWITLLYVSRLLSAAILRFTSTSKAAAHVAGKWTFVLALIVLILIALNTLHIPFTAFAFLGGTLAIGIGFGAQNLLKNFISGIILTLERPIKVGDLVGVSGIVGHVQQIGMRASVIRHLNGIDTLVPNSQILEDQVSNWTLDDNILRGRITVGVAYGSDSDIVARALFRVANQNSQVLQSPRPEVRFEDFGDNALVFSLLYWFDASREQGERLASTMRYAINRELTEEGVVLAFPQRDIHFDDDKPLRVEVSSTPKGS